MNTADTLRRSRRISADRVGRIVIGRGRLRTAPGLSMGSRLLRPKFVSDLWERLTIEIWDIVETAIDRRHLIFGQVQDGLLLPKLIEGKIIT